MWRRLRGRRRFRSVVRSPHSPSFSTAVPIFQQSSLRFFLVYNSKLKLFRYILAGTVQVTDEFVPSRRTDRIIIGNRTDFAFYLDHRLDRKILIGVFEGHARANNYFDGP